MTILTRELIGVSNNWIAWTVCVSIIVTVLIICLVSIAKIQAHMPCMAPSATLSYEPYSRNTGEEIQCTQEYIYLYEEYTYM